MSKGRILRSERSRHRPLAIAKKLNLSGKRTKQPPTLPRSKRYCSALWFCLSPSCVVCVLVASPSADTKQWAQNSASSRWRKTILSVRESQRCCHWSYWGQCAVIYKYRDSDSAIEGSKTTLFSTIRSLKFTYSLPRRAKRLQRSRKTAPLMSRSECNKRLKSASRKRRDRQRKVELTETEGGNRSEG